MADWGLCISYYFALLELSDWLLSCLEFGLVGDIDLDMEWPVRTRLILPLKPVITKFHDLYIILCIFHILNIINEKPISIIALQGKSVLIQIGDFEARPIKWSDFKGEVD